MIDTLTKAFRSKLLKSDKYDHCFGGGSFGCTPDTLYKEATGIWCLGAGAYGNAIYLVVNGTQSGSSRDGKADYNKTLVNEEILIDNIDNTEQIVEISRSY